jgi:hypothetical protein
LTNELLLDLCAACVVCLGSKILNICARCILSVPVTLSHENVRKGFERSQYFCEQTWRTEKTILTSSHSIYFCSDSQVKRRLEFNEEAPTDPLAKQQKTH